jgi:DNA-binding transcriptional LysR family regulator
MESKTPPKTAGLLDSVLANRLRMKHLALLSALDSCRNLHKAAELIHVSQPSATKLLQETEVAFGMALFERRAPGMVPTDLGVEVVRYATHTLAQLRLLDQDLKAKQSGGYGHLAIGMIMAAAPDLLAHAILQLKSQYPLINVQLMGETSDQILPLLEQHQLDLAVGRFSDPLQHNHFDFEELQQESLVFAARAGHPLSQRPGLLLNELAEWPWVLQPLPNPARVLLEKEFAANRMSTPVNFVECSSVFALLQLLTNGDSVALISESVVRDHLRTGLLCRLPLEINGRLPGFGILTRRNGVLRPVALAFIEALRAVVADLSGKKRKQDRPQ